MCMADGLQNLLDGVAFLESHRLLIGIPEAESARSGPITNVQLAFIHTNGSPRMHIPARPFLEPAINDVETKEKITGCMKQAILCAFSGDTGGAEAEMEKAGLYGQKAAQSMIGSGALAPNAPITVEGGWMRNPVSGKPVHIEGKGSSAPLIDTGSLRKAITYVVEGD